MIDIQQIDLNSLPSVPLAKKKSLPTATGIYFAIDSLGNVQYIGKAGGKTVDYDQPCPILGQALVDADINPWWALPAKHRMWISRDRIEVREGYPSEIVEVK